MISSGATWSSSNYAGKQRWVIETPRQAKGMSHLVRLR